MDKNKDKYIHALNKILQETGTRQIIMIGDMNAQVERQKRYHTLSSFGESVVNYNGHRLITNANSTT